MLAELLLDLVELLSGLLLDLVEPLVATPLEPLVNPLESLIGLLEPLVGLLAKLSEVDVHLRAQSSRELREIGFRGGVLPPCDGLCGGDRLLLRNVRQFQRLIHFCVDVAHLDSSIRMGR